MSRERPSQLQLVRGLAEAREKELAGELGELMRQCSTAQATLDRLGGYLDEYTDGARGRQATARPVSEMENERRFVRRLGAALEQQRTHARRLTARTSESMERWQRARSELEALDRVMQRRAREKECESRRSEQRESDAHSARQSRAPNPETET